MKSKSKSIEIYLLVFLVGIEAVGALFGGYNLIKDPSGESIKLPIKLIEATFFPNYLIPGIILFLFLGLFPILLIYPLILKPRWKRFNFLNIYPGYHWAWTYTLYTSIILISWINLQVMILGTGSIVQGAYGMFGVIILILTLMPRVKQFYRVSSHRKQSRLIKHDSTQVAK
jgi:hypothetical protein